MHKILLSTLALSLAPLVQADIPRIYPSPQKNLLEDKLTTIEEVEVVILTQQDQKTYKPSVAWTAIPQKEGAYGIIIKPGKLFVLAYDEAGAFYARQTIIQLLSETKGDRYLYAQKDPVEGQSIEQLVMGNQLPLGDIYDWPDMPFRGSIEGYYGKPWSHDDRKAQFEFYGRNKLNTYIWAPKDDPYHHGVKSYELYPEKEAAEIRELCDVARKNHVKFIWMVHPANTIQWVNNGGKPDLDRLVTKLEAMYDLGVRDFAVSVDDSGGDIGKAENQVTLCNYIKTHFIDKKSDVGPLIMCPTGYNKAWANTTYLKTLGDGLHKDILVMWTGDNVCADITVQGQEWIQKTLGRPTFIWWNWPVHDYCPAHLALGRTYGLEQDPKMRELMTGFSSNPMALAEASKTGLFGVGDYSWNIMGFQSDENWKDGMKRLYPSSHAALQTFANHNSDLGNNYHRYRREESVAFAPTAEKLTKSMKENKLDQEALAAARAEFKALKAATEVIASAPDTKLLAEEIAPWIALSAELGDVGDAACTAAAQPTLANFSVLQKHWDSFNEGAPDRTQHRPLVSGWTVMRPLVFAMSDYSQDRIFEDQFQQKRKDASTATVKPAGKDLSQPHVRSNVADLEKLRVSRQQNKFFGIDKVLEVKTLAPQQYIEMVFPVPVDASWMEINLENGSLAQWAQVELTLADGSTMKPQFDMQGSVMTAKGGQLPKQRISKMRLSNTGSQTEEIKLNMFKLDCAPLDSRFDKSSLFDRDLLSYFSASAGLNTTLDIPAGTKEIIVISENAEIEKMEKNATGGSIKLAPDTTSFTIECSPASDARIYEIIFKK